MSKIDRAREAAMRDFKRARVYLRNLGITSVEENRSCSGKGQYTEKKEAWRDVNRMIDQTGHNLRAYKCRFCPFWHYGHSNRPPRYKTD